MPTYKTEKARFLGKALRPAGATFHLAEPLKKPLPEGVTEVGGDTAKQTAAAKKAAAAKAAASKKEIEQHAPKGQQTFMGNNAGQSGKVEIV